MTNEEAIQVLHHIVQVADTSDCGIKEIDGIDEEAIEMAIKALEQGDILQEIWNKTYRLHPINRGDNDYANGVYDGMCRVIDIVCNTIDSKIKELSE